MFLELVVDSINLLLNFVLVAIINFLSGLIIGYFLKDD